MRNILLLLLSISFIFSSCSNSVVSVTKRQHRPGYYVDFNNNSGIDSRTAVASLPPGFPEQKVSEDIAVNDTADKLTSECKSLPEKELESAGSGQLKNVSASRRLVKKAAQPIREFMRENSRENIAAVSGTDEQSGILKNLIWFIIVLLLLVYIVAISAGGFGLGAAVHLLLIAALILLFIKLITPL